MPLDPHKPQQIAIVGKKGFGKSVLARRLWDTWPYDRLMIDPTGDAGKNDDPRELRTLDGNGMLPSRWPAKWLEDSEGQRKRQSLRLLPDMGSPTFIDDMDRALGLAYHHGRTLAWVDEMGELFHAGRVPPYGRRALHQGRHRELTMVLCGPRPMNVDPLVLAQADQVYVFTLPNPADRRRVADAIGWDPKEFDGLVHALPKYGFLRYRGDEGELDICDPLPFKQAGAA